MPADLKIGEHVYPFYLKFDVFRYVDAFAHSSLRETVLDGLVYIQQKYKLNFHGWIVMTSSIRFIASCSREDVSPEQVADSFMSYTDKKLLQNIHYLRNEIKRKWMEQLFESNRKSKQILFWHSRYTLETISSHEDFGACLTDIHESPVLSGIVWDAQNYMYSSAIDYINNEPGLLSIVKLASTDGVSI